MSRNQFMNNAQPEEEPEEEAPQESAGLQHLREEVGFSTTAQVLIENFEREEERKRRIAEEDSEALDVNVDP